MVNDLELGLWTCDVENHSVNRMAGSQTCHLSTVTIRVDSQMAKKGKGFPYSIPSVGPGADPSVQAVSPQVTVSHPSGGRLPLLSARPVVNFPSRRASPPFGRYKVILLGDRGT